MKEATLSPPSRELLAAALEAVIFAAGEPVSLRDLSEAFGGVDVAEIDAAVDELMARYRADGYGLQVERVAGGLRFATRPEVSQWVRQFFRQRNRTRLTPASCETLAIVAYRQPVTAPEIQAIRGVDSSASLKSLLDRKLLRILGKKKVVGNPLLYGTSKQFLVHFGLDRLEDLPPVDSFGDLLADETSDPTPISPSVAAHLEVTEEGHAGAMDEALEIAGSEEE